MEDCLFFSQYAVDLLDMWQEAGTKAGEVSKITGGKWDFLAKWIKNPRESLNQILAFVEQQNQDSVSTQP